MLFERSGFDYRDQLVKRAAEMAEGLTPQQLQAPDLVSSLEQWVSTYPMQVAKLRPEGRHGKRRTEVRIVSDYGHNRQIEYSVIDVSIPFEGSPESLLIGPSRRTLIDQPAQVTHGILKASFPDDDHLDANVDRFIKTVSETLDTLRSELANLPQQLLDTATRVAKRRADELTTRLAKDKGRSFPID